MVIDGRGRTYEGDLGFNMAAGLLSGPYGRIILLAPGEPARIVADGLNFPNGIAVSDDHQTLVVAETTGGPEAAGALCWRLDLSGQAQPESAILSQLLHHSTGHGLVSSGCAALRYLGTGHRCSH
jgi:hypothetical protein